MRTNIPEKIHEIIDDIDERGNEPLTRLAVLTKWFKQPERLSVFGLWIARRAAGRKGKTGGLPGELLDEARKTLGTASTAESVFQKIPEEIAKSLYERARNAQSEFKLGQVPCKPLLLVEKGLAVHLGISGQPTDGYELVADWAGNDDRRHGRGLNGPSRGKLRELVRFMFAVEALEDWRERSSETP